MAGGSSVSSYDARPFLEKALAFGVKERILRDAQIAAIRAEGPKGMVQIADFFGTSHLRANLEEARQRIVALASLYLEDYSGGDLGRAAMSLRDNTFLSHSRGGSDLLKKLHALPPSMVFGDIEHTTIRDFLETWSKYGLRIHAAYRSTLADRREAETALAAGAWFGEQMGIARSSLEAVGSEEFLLTSADSVIRTAILMRLADDMECPNRADFLKLAIKLRAKGLSARGRKKLETPDPAVPPAYRALEASISAAILQNDIPAILNKDFSFELLLRERDPEERPGQPRLEVPNLRARYYLRPTGIDEVSEYDAMVSAEWTKVMKGKTEPDARLTVFLCIAAGLAPKPSISETTAKSIVRKLRENGIDSAAVLKFIQDCAPFDLKDSLVELWSEEFVPDAEVALFDRRDEKLALAMQFLKENCHVTSPKK